MRDVIATGKITVDASLASLEFLLREGAIRTKDFSGSGALFKPAEE